jgi:hypothetical protein
MIITIIRAVREVHEQRLAPALTHDLLNLRLVTNQGDYGVKWTEIAG